jgi:hypothetical protein
VEHDDAVAGDGDMTGVNATVQTAEAYRRFAAVEAAGRSASYEALAYAVAEDDVVLAFLGRLPPIKRQPHLLFAAAWYLLGSPPVPRSLHDLIASNPGNLQRIMLDRKNQTNEPARCAVLLPALAGLPEPLALLEVGAAAGLTLLPDVYSYDYDGFRIAGVDPEAPTFRCRPVGPVPLPQRVPNVVWRAGIDLNPLDVRSGEDMSWLSCLIWPGEADRAEHLQAAVAAARRHPPVLRRGDLLDDLADVVATAPADATLVVYHTAVLAYVDETKRRAFADAVSDLGVVWLSNERSWVLRCIGIERDDPGSFLLVRDGQEILARTDPHGTWVEWVA